MNRRSALMTSVHGSVANAVDARKSGLRMQIAQQDVTGLESKDAIRLSVAYTYCGFEQTSHIVRGSFEIVTGNRATDSNKARTASELCSISSFEYPIDCNGNR
jgi:hypothetical protein